MQRMKSADNKKNTFFAKKLPIPEKSHEWKVNTYAERYFKSFDKGFDRRIKEQLKYTSQNLIHQ